MGAETQFMQLGTPGRNFQDRGHSKCKGPGAEMGLAGPTEHRGYRVVSVPCAAHLNSLLSLSGCSPLGLRWAQSPLVVFFPVAG